MTLRPLLDAFNQDAGASRLAREGGRAFVSSSLRPYAIAALADRDTTRPTLVVVGDDRAARNLAGDLRAWLAPRRVRLYPSRGVAYESHLTPPPHLVGLRIAALDALISQVGLGASAEVGRASGASAGRARAGDAREAPVVDVREAPVVVISAVALSEKV